MNKMTVKDVDLKGKNVIIRCDFNVPLDDNLNITDDIRIQAALPTIKYVLEQDPSKVILMSHLGRPKGEVKENMRLTPVSKRLSELLGEKVLQMKDCVGNDVKTAIESSSERVIVLENLRFHKEETANDPEFAKQLADLADIYVNDAFGTAHRAHASTEGITKYLTSVAGFLLEKEITFLGKAINDPERPFAVILGGAKVSDKIMLIENLLDKADIILIGGGMAYTFLKAKGVEIGMSLLEEDKIETAKEIMKKAAEKGVRIALSKDYYVVRSFDHPEEKKIWNDDIDPEWEAIDIGPVTQEKFKNILKDMKTIIWNGPLGVFEIDAFAEGTKAIADFLAELDATVIVGGGDSAAAVKKFGVADKMTHISTGGGASLEFLEGKVLPGVEALTDKK